MATRSKNRPYLLSSSLPFPLPFFIFFSSLFLLISFLFLTTCLLDEFSARSAGDRDGYRPLPLFLFCFACYLDRAHGTALDGSGAEHRLRASPISARGAGEGTRCERRPLVCGSRLPWRRKHAADVLAADLDKS